MLTSLRFWYFKILTENQWMVKEGARKNGQGTLKNEINIHIPNLILVKKLYSVILFYPFQGSITFRYLLPWRYQKSSGELIPKYIFYIFVAFILLFSGDQIHVSLQVAWLMFLKTSFSFLMFPVWRFPFEEKLT